MIDLAVDSLLSSARALLQRAHADGLRSLTMNGRKRTVGFLFRAAPMLGLLVEAAIRRHPELLSDGPRDIGARQRRVSDLRVLSLRLSALSQLAHDTYLREQAALNREVVGFVRSVSQADPADARAAARSNALLLPLAFFRRLGRYNSKLPPARRRRPS